MDLSQWNGEEPVELKGPWDFYWNKLLEPGQLQDQKPDAAISVNSSWNKVARDGEQELKSLAYATYRLQIKGLRPHPEGYLLRVPRINSSYRLWVIQDSDQKILTYTKAGNLSKDFDQFRPSNRSRFIPIHSTSNTSISVLIQVADFSLSSAGFVGTPLLSPTNFLLSMHLREAIPSIFSLGICFGLATYLFMLWFRHKSLKASFWLAIGTLGVFTFTLTTEPSLISLFSDSSYHLRRSLEFMAMPFSTLCLLAFFYEAYSQEQSNKLAKSSINIIYKTWYTLSFGLFLIPVFSPTQVFSS